MPNVTFSKKRIVQNGITLAELPSLIERLGMEIEEEDPSDITISITPNRPDMLDATGLCRALRFISSRHVPRAKRYALEDEIALNINVDKNVNLIRPYIAGMVIEDADLSNGKLVELIDFSEKFCDTFGRKRKKVAIGIHNMDAIDGDIKYCASSEGTMRPLGSLKEHKFSSVIESTKQGREYGHLLHGEYLSISDRSKTLALIPIINSEDTKIGENTTRLLIDITGTSKAGVDDAAAIIACSFIDQGARVRPCRVINNGKNEITPALNYREMKVRVSTIESTIGVKISPSKIVGLANKLGYNAARLGISSLYIVPPYRIDVISTRDIIEDMAIAYGYDNIVPSPILASTIGAKNLNSSFDDLIAHMMVGFGFMEAINMYITTQNECFSQMRLDYDPKQTVTITNSKSGSIMRSSILPSLIKNISISTQERMPYRLFEIGPIFRVDNGIALESDSLAIVSCHPKADFAEIKSYVKSMLSLLGINQITLKESCIQSLIPGRQASFSYMGISIGSFGELHPEILSNYKIEEPIACAEIDLKALYKAIGLAENAQK